ncbi:MAG: restriction endonuclease [Brevinematales bacterium]|nr:restriction endonuclease [Brevinematales bacterium]
MKNKLTIDKLIEEARSFCIKESETKCEELFGITDGKAIGTYIEHKFKERLTSIYELEIGSSASGIDLPSPGILTDIKVTSIEQPQSSCPFEGPKQKIYGLGYNLLIFVYDKKDDSKTKTANLKFVSCSFVESKRTADYTTTYRLRQMINDGANENDIIAYLLDRNIPADEMTLSQLAKQILENPPEQGYLTISNALQWRLQYQRIVNLNENIDGITKIISNEKK